MPIQFGPNVVIAGRFRLNRQLGRGGMGSVWHATHLGLDVPCAVKFIEGEIAALPEAQARFEREAKAAAQLRSPNVVQILDHGVYEGLPYIAMELLEGEDVGKRLTRIGRMPAYELVRIVNQVTRALAKAHAMGVVHRDLKPDNIFLVRDEDREIAKVLDFGIAKAQTTNSISGSNTKTGAMLGTPYYMSPEQAQGTKQVDHRSDLWSLAVIVFQALTGVLPFESEALGDLLIKIIVSPIPMPSDYVKDLPPAFDRWWHKASQRDPAQRWQSAKELSEGLGLVFGLTPGASVVEASARGSFATGDPAFQMTPAPTGPGAYARAPGASPAFAQTPGGPAMGLAAPGQPFAMTPSQPGFPSPGLGVTPAPGGAFGASPTTGTPMSRSLLGAPGIPKHSRTGLWVALAGGLLVLAVAVAGVSLAMKGKQPPATSATAGEQATAPAAATSAPSAGAMAVPAALPALTEPATSVTTPTAQAPSAAPSSAGSLPAAKPSKSQVPAQAAPAHPAAPPPAHAPATPSKPRPVDLGI
jgi:serine/threonine-protein kinase